MALLPNELYLHGTCDLTIAGKAMPFVNCHLNLADQQLHCYFEDTGSSRSSGIGDGPYTLRNLALSSPVGTLHCADVEVAFAAYSRGAGWSSTTTTISHALALNSKVASVSFIVNEPLIFRVPSDDEERLYFPGFDLAGSVRTDGSALITGSKAYIGISGCAADQRVIATSLGIAIGAPVREFARLVDGQLKLILNSYGSTIVPRPMVDMGWPWREIDLARRNIAALFDCCVRYLTELDAQDQSRFSDAVASYLQARTLTGSYELKMLAAYHFLEWLDGSRTMSRDAVANALAVSKQSAKAICDVRNNLTHNAGDLGIEIERAVRSILNELGPSRADIMQTEPSRIYMDYLFTQLGNALLRIVGYRGETRPYLPL